MSAWEIRLRSLANVALIPYVAVRFPRELRGYLKRTWRALYLGRTDWPARFGR